MLPPTFGRAGNRRASVAELPTGYCFPLFGLDAGPGHLQVRRVQVDADVIAAELAADQADSAGPGERVENDAGDRIGGGAGADGAEAKSFRE